MQSLNIQTNQNHQQKNNYQCEFNYIGCKTTFPSKGEVKQHYKDSLNNHLLLLQEKIKKIDSVNYDIKKDYHRLFKIISNIQQFKKFPDICPNPKETEDKEEEISKNKLRKKDIEKDKIINNQNLQNLILNQINKNQNLEEMIGNKRKRNDELKLNDNNNKNEEIFLLSAEDDNNGNNFVHNDERKHKIFINKSEDSNNENNVESKKNRQDRNDSFSNHKRDKEIIPIILNSKENENIIINNINNKNNNEEMNVKQIKSFLLDKENSSKNKINLLEKNFSIIYDKSPENKNENEINQSQIIRRKASNDIKKNNDKNNIICIENNINNNETKNPPYKDMVKYEILSMSDNDDDIGEAGGNDNTQYYFQNIINNDINKIQNPNLNQDKGNKEKNYYNKITRIDYIDKVLNDKKVKWEVELKKITGWFAIGVSENLGYDINSNNKNLLEYNNGKYFLSNENIFNNMNDNKRVKMNFDLKEGDNLICLYSPKFKQLKIKNGNSEYLIDNVEAKSGKPLVPTAFFENKSDQVIFHDFKVLADYKK